jgi:CHASE2 domain-containing sensor protein
MSDKVKKAISIIVGIFLGAICGFFYFLLATTLDGYTNTAIGLTGWSWISFGAICIFNALIVLFHRKRNIFLAWCYGISATIGSAAFLLMLVTIKIYY